MKAHKSVFGVLSVLLCLLNGSRAAPSIGTMHTVHSPEPQIASTLIDWFPLKKKLSGRNEASVAIGDIVVRESTVREDPQRKSGRAGRVLPNHGTTNAPIVGNNDDAGDLENEMKYELLEEEKKEVKEEDAVALGVEAAAETEAEAEPPGNFTIFYLSALNMAGSLINLVVIATGFFLVGTILCIAALNDPCGCEERLAARLIDRDSLLVVVQEEEGERIGLLENFTDRSDLYKTNEQCYVFIPRDTNGDDEYSGII